MMTPSANRARHFRKAAELSYRHLVLENGDTVDAPPEVLARIELDAEIESGIAGVVAFHAFTGAAPQDYLTERERLTTLIQQLHNDAVTRPVARLIFERSEERLARGLVGEAPELLSLASDLEHDPNPPRERIHRIWRDAFRTRQLARGIVDAAEMVARRQRGQLLRLGWGPHHEGTPGAVDSHGRSAAIDQYLHEVAKQIACPAFEVPHLEFLERWRETRKHYLLMFASRHEMMAAEQARQRAIVAFVGPPAAAHVPELHRIADDEIFVAHSKQEAAARSIGSDIIDRGYHGQAFVAIARMTQSPEHALQRFDDGWLSAAQFLDSHWAAIEMVAEAEEQAGPLSRREIDHLIDAAGEPLMVGADGVAS